MTTSEKVAYLKGLADGLALDTETKEGKLITSIIDVLEDMALDLEDLTENALDLGEEIDALSDDLADVEELLFEDDYDEDEDDEDYSHHHHHHHHGHCCGADEDDMPVFYEVTCPSCGNTITVDEEVLDLGEIACPNCGENLEFDFDEDPSEEEED